MHFYRDQAIDSLEECQKLENNLDVSTDDNGDAGGVAEKRVAPEQSPPLSSQQRRRLLRRVLKVFLVRQLAILCFFGCLWCLNLKNVSGEHFLLNLIQMSYRVTSFFNTCLRLFYVYTEKYYFVFKNVVICILL